MRRGKVITLVNMMKPIVTLLQHPQGADWIVIVIIDLARRSSIEAIHGLVERGHMRVS